MLDEHFKIRQRCWSIGISLCFYIGMYDRAIYQAISALCTSVWWRFSDALHILQEDFRSGPPYTCYAPTTSCCTPFDFLRLGNSAQTAASATSIASTIGISTCTPFACAIAPMANGNMQAPAAPNAAANPIPATCRWAGRSLVAATTAAGKRGARKKPSRATTTKETYWLGTR